MGMWWSYGKPEGSETEVVMCWFLLLEGVYILMEDWTSRLFPFFLSV